MAAASQAAAAASTAAGIASRPAFCPTSSAAKSSGRDEQPRLCRHASRRPHRDGERRRDVEPAPPPARRGRCRGRWPGRSARRGSRSPRLTPVREELGGDHRRGPRVESVADDGGQPTPARRTGPPGSPHRAASATCASRPDREPAGEQQRRHAAAGRRRARRGRAIRRHLRDDERCERSRPRSRRRRSSYVRPLVGGRSGTARPAAPSPPQLAEPDEQHVADGRRDQARQHDPEQAPRRPRGPPPRAASRRPAARRTAPTSPRTSRRWRAPLRPARRCARTAATATLPTADPSAMTGSLRARAPHRSPACRLAASTTPGTAPTGVGPPPRPAERLVPAVAG